MSGYQQQFQTDFESLNNGLHATVFSSYSDQTLDLHLSQMAQSGIDTIAFQRFSVDDDGEGPIRDAILKKLMRSAEKYGRKVYAMFGCGHNIEINQNDWLQKISKWMVSSPAYARQNGKPVVALWGCGFDYNWNANVSEALELLHWFQKEQGAYVIAGVPFMWRRQEWGGVREGFTLDVFKKFDMISPWGIGRVDSSNVDQLERDVRVDDQKFCNENGLDYQPCVLPGPPAWRHHGDFMWRQFYNVKKTGAQGIYVTMFDEYQECNQIAKTAESMEWIPKGFYKNDTTLDYDGVKCSADYYLRLTRDGGKMFKGLMRLTEERPTKPWAPEM